jgi:cobalt-zinc-cadmium efflux system membrane fusion protein
MYSRLFIFSFSLVWFGVGCASKVGGGEEAYRQEEVVVLSVLQRAGVGVRVEALKPQALRIEKRLWGKTVILAHAQASLHAPMEGIVREIIIREGQWVPKGAVCFWIYAPGALDLQKQYAETYQQRQATLVRLAQQESLAQQRLLSLSEVEQTRRMLKALERQLYSLEGQLRYVGLEPDTLGQVHLLAVRAPISGHVSRVSVVLGQYVRIETELARLVDNTDLHADFYLTERDLGWVRVGMPLEVFFPGLPELKPISTRIEYVAQVDDTTGTHLIAHAALEGLRMPIAAGVPVEGRTFIVQDSVYVVPRSAVVFHGRQAYLFMVEGDSVFRPVGVEANFIDTLAVVRGEGLRLGMPIVVEGAPYVGAQLWTVGEE